MSAEQYTDQSSEQRGVIGRRVLDIAKGKGISQQDIAAKLGITRPSVSAWRNSDPHAKDITRIAEILKDVSIEYILTGQEDESKKQITELKSEEYKPGLVPTNTFVEQVLNVEKVLIRLWCPANVFIPSYNNPRADDNSTLTMWLDNQIGPRMQNMYIQNIRGLYPLFGAYQYLWSLGFYFYNPMCEVLHGKTYKNITDNKNITMGELRNTYSSEDQ